MSKSQKKQAPNAFWRSRPEQAKSAVLKSFSSASGQRTYTHAIDEFVGFYSSEPRLALIAPSCCGTASTSNNARMHPPPSTSDWPRCVV